MKAIRLFLSAVAAFALFSSYIQAQTASTICLEEARQAFNTIDEAVQTAQDSAVFIQWSLTAKFREKPGMPPLVSRESMIYTRDKAIYMSQDYNLYADRQEAFNHQLNQYTIYRVKSTLGKMPVMQGIDGGIFQYASVKYCGFYKAEIPEERTWKERYITLNLDGMRKYNVSGIRLITDPVDGSLKVIHVEYYGTSMYTEAEYRFIKIDTHYKPEGGVKKISDYFLAPDGKLLPDYGTTKILDYRK